MCEHLSDMEPALAKVMIEIDLLLDQVCSITNDEKFGHYADPIIFLTGDIKERLEKIQNMHNAVCYGGLKAIREAA